MGQMGDTKAELWPLHDSVQGQSPEELVLQLSVAL